MSAVVKSKSSLRVSISSLQRGIAILIDPEKFSLLKQFDTFIESLSSPSITFLLVGGSTCDRDEFLDCVSHVKRKAQVPVILFPGSAQQVSDEADGILFLSLLSGRNSKYLIEQQIEAAEEVESSGIEVLSTAYILIDGGHETSVQQTSKTRPLSHSDIPSIQRTVLAAKHLGFQLVYLDAGSGAQDTIPLDVVKSVKKIGLPLIVGGGVRNVQQIKDFHDAGANLVVIGNFIEENPSFIRDLEGYSTTP
jgi:phosphoglycerol geranylgeranyltransferase